MKKAGIYNRLLVAMSLLAGLTTAQASTYTVSIFNPLSGHSVAVNDINNLGQVVGRTSIGDSSDSAFIWESGKMSLLASPSGTISEAYAINDAGLIIGYVYRPGDALAQSHAWGTVTPNMPLLGWNEPIPTALNNSGQAVGFSYKDYESKALIWNQSGSSILGHGQARAINDLGVVVGEGIIGTNAAVWANGQASNLPPLDWTIWYSRALDINNQGQIVGNATTHGGTAYAMLWEEWQHSGTYTSRYLPALGGAYSNAYARGINESGLVVGESYTSGFDLRAVMWENHRIIDLNDLVDPSLLAEGWVLTSAKEINDQGWIIGDASNDRLGISRPFVMVREVPEPSSFMLLSAGFAMLFFGRRSNTTQNGTGRGCT